jgi:hypothetical protein
MAVSGFLGKLFGGDAGKAGTADGLLRAYGKLPMYAEYRRLEVSPGLPTTFSQWMDAGRLAWVQSPTKTPHGVTCNCRLLLRLNDPKELIVARLWDSRDSLGRVFPFAFFVTCPADALGDSPATRWNAARAVHDQLEAVHGEVSALGSGGDFYKRFHKRGVDLRPAEPTERSASALSAADRLDAGEVFRGWAPNELDPAAWAGGLARRCERWRGPALPESALRLPLSPKHDALAQETAWLRWIEPLAARGGRPISIIDSSESTGVNAMTLLFRDLTPGDFQFATSDADAHPDQERLSRPPPGESGVGSPPEGSLASWLLERAPRPA